MLLLMLQHLLMLRILLLLRRRSSLHSSRIRKRHHRRRRSRLHGSKAKAKQIPPLGELCGCGYSFPRATFQRGAASREAKQQQNINRLKSLASSVELSFVRVCEALAMAVCLLPLVRARREHRSHRLPPIRPSLRTCFSLFLFFLFLFLFSTAAILPSPFPSFLS